MKRYIVIFVTVALAAIGVVFAAPSANWNNGGWIISDSYTNPNPIVFQSHIGSIKSGGTASFDAAGKCFNPILVRLKGRSC